MVLISTEHYNFAIDWTKPAQKAFKILDYNGYKPLADTMDQMVSGYFCKRAKRNVRRHVYLMELTGQLLIPHLEQRTTNPIVWGIQHIK